MFTSVLTVQVNLYVYHMFTSVLMVNLYVHCMFTSVLRVQLILYVRRVLVVQVNSVSVVLAGDRGEHL